MHPIYPAAHTKHARPVGRNYAGFVRDVSSDPTSPQTGYDFGIESIVLLAVLCGGVALYVGRKANA